MSSNSSPSSMSLDALVHQYEESMRVQSETLRRMRKEFDQFRNVESSSPRLSFHEEKRREVESSPRDENTSPSSFGLFSDSESDGTREQCSDLASSSSLFPFSPSTELKSEEVSTTRNKASAGSGQRDSHVDSKLRGEIGVLLRTLDASSLLPVVDRFSREESITFMTLLEDFHRCTRRLAQANEMIRIGRMQSSPSSSRKKASDVQDSEVRSSLPRDFESSEMEASLVIESLRAEIRSLQSRLHREEEERRKDTDRAQQRLDLVKRSERDARFQIRAMEKKCNRLERDLETCRLEFSKMSTSLEDRRAKSQRVLDEMLVHVPKSISSQSEARRVFQALVDEISSLRTQIVQKDRQIQDLNYDITELERLFPRRTNRQLNSKSNESVESSSHSDGFDSESDGFRSLRSRVRELEKALQSSHEQIDFLRDSQVSSFQRLEFEKQALIDALEEAEFELSQRPTFQEYRSVVEELESRGGKIPRKNLSSAFRHSIILDRESARLGLASSASIPVEKLRSLVQEACVTLGLSGYEALIPTLENVKKLVEIESQHDLTLKQVDQVLKDLSLAEIFSATSSDIVFSVQELGKRYMESKSLIEKIQPLLLRYHIVEPIGFFSNDEHDEQHSKISEQSVRFSSGGLDVLSAALSLYHSAHEWKLNGKVSHQASQPEEDIASQFTSHFMTLFDVSAVEGIFTKANELYLFVNEYQNRKRLEASMRHGSSSQSS